MTTAVEWPGGHMPGLQFVGPNSLAWQIRDIPPAEPGSVLVGVEAVGLCGTDVDLFTGKSAFISSGHTAYPFQPGHEFCGKVVAVGPGVTDLVVGDRVVGEPFLPCLHCRKCRSGQINLCPNRSELGVRGSVPGAAAQYLRIPQGNLARVPDGVEPFHALMAEPAVTVLNSLSTAKLESGQRVAVIGPGTLGLIATQIASATGARVDTIGRGPKLALALEAGASAVLAFDEAPDDTYDVVLEASGAASALELAIRIAAAGGHIAQVGVPGDPSDGVAASELVMKGLTISGVLGGVAFLDRAVQLIADNVIKPEQLLGAVFPWFEAEKAFEAITSGEQTRPKTVLDFNGLDLDRAIEYGVR